jgi:hypothetical protein
MIDSTAFLRKITMRTIVTIAEGLLLIFGLSACASVPAKFPIKVTTAPSDALVSIRSSNSQDELSLQAIAGPTPLEKNFKFGSQNKIWLQIEKRGYAPKQVSITPDVNHIDLKLDRLYNADGTPVPEYHLPSIRRMLLVPADFSVIERGFSTENVSEERSVKAQQALNTGIATGLKNKCEVVKPKGKSDAAQIKALWRDGHTAMVLTNPVRLRYQPEPPLLETSSGRSAAQALGLKYNSDVIMLVEGKQIEETASMLTGKIGMTVIGTATSYAGGYSRAAANGDSFFTYTIYTPQFSQGALINALMIDCRNAEVLWTNHGLWKPIDFEAPQTVAKVIEDLFTGIIDKKGEK